MSGGFPVDLILFAMVAAFLVLRLRSVLGRRTGFERPRRPRRGPRGLRSARCRRAAPARPRRRPAPPAGVRSRQPRAAGPAQPAGPGAGAHPAARPQLRAGRFLDGAEGAFRMVVQASPPATGRRCAACSPTRPMPASSGDHRARAGGREPAHRATRDERGGDRGGRPARHHRGCHRPLRHRPGQHDHRPGRRGPCPAATR